MNLKIPDKLFFKIGEVAELAGVEQHVLRYWEDEFDALSPNKNKSGQRLYEKKDVELILEIQHLLYQDKYTIAGAKKKLKEKRKKNTQLSLGFDRETFLSQKKKIVSELESILKVIGDGKSWASTGLYESGWKDARGVTSAVAPFYLGEKGTSYGD